MTSRIAQALRGLSLKPSLESDVEASTTTGDGDQTVTAQVEEAQTETGDAAIGEAEAQELTTTTVEVAEGAETESAETVIEDADVMGVPSQESLTLAALGFALAAGVVSATLGHKAERAHQEKLKLEDLLAKKKAALAAAQDKVTEEVKKGLEKAKHEKPDALKDSDISGMGIVAGMSYTMWLAHIFPAVGALVSIGVFTTTYLGAVKQVKKLGEEIAEIESQIADKQIEILEGAKDTVSTESETDVDADTTTGDGEQTVKADAADAQDTPADGAGAPGEDKDLTTKIVDVAEGADTESAETEVSGDATVSQEGFGGALLGFLAGGSGWAPFVGAGIHGAVKAKRLKMREDIETIAKRIDTIRRGDLEKAKKDGVDVPSKIKDLDWFEIVKSAILGQVFGSFYGAHQGSELQDLNKELRAKIKELKRELDRAGVSYESIADDCVTVDASDAANAAAIAAAAGVAQGAAAAAEAAAAAVEAVTGQANVEGDAAASAAGEAADEATDVATDVADQEIEDGHAEIEALEGDIVDGEEHAEEYEQAAATMESLIDALQDAQRTGGLTPQGARFFNIGFESIGVRLTGAPFQNARGEAAIPSLESFGGTMRRDTATQISMESASEWLNKILEVLRKTWAQIVEWVKKFVKAVFSQAARYGQRANALLAAAKKLNGVKPKNRTITFGQAGKIAIGKRVDVDTLDQVLGVAAFSSEQAAGGQAMSDGFAKVLNDASQKLKTVTDGDGWQAMLAGAIEHDLAHASSGGLDAARSALYKHRRVDGINIVYSTDVLPGNVVLELTSKNADKDALAQAAATISENGIGEYVKQAVTAAVKAGRTVVQHDGTELADSDLELPTLTAGQIEHVAKSVRIILKSAELTEKSIDQMRADFRAQVTSPDDQSKVAKAVIQALASGASKNMSDYCGGVSKALKYAVATSGVFLEYARASLKQYTGEQSNDEKTAAKVAGESAAKGKDDLPPAPPHKDPLVV